MAPKANDYKRMVFVDQKPKFLQNAMAALGGGSRRRSNSPDSRPPIPERPSDDDYQDPSSDEEAGPSRRRRRSEEVDGEGLDRPEEDELGDGDEAPQVVVLREGKDLSKDEARKLRGEGGKLNDPNSSTRSKPSGSLTFSSSTLSETKSKILAKRKAREEEDGDWNDLLKKAKVDREAVKKDPKKAEEKKRSHPDKGGTSAPGKKMGKDDKKEKKEKKKDKAKQGPLSFDE